MWRLNFSFYYYVYGMCAVCAGLPEKAVPEMTYTVSGGTLNPLTQSCLRICGLFHRINFYGVSMPWVSCWTSWIFFPFLRTLKSAWIWFLYWKIVGIEVAYGIWKLLNSILCKMRWLKGHGSFCSKFLCICLDWYLLEIVSMGNFE